MTAPNPYRCFQELMRRVGGLGTAIENEMPKWLMLH